MGLFFNRNKVNQAIEREITFNKEVLQRNLAKLSGGLYDYRKDESHKVFVEFLQNLIDAEMLEMTRTKELTQKAYSYHRGRIDGLRHALSLRDKFIADKERAKKIKGKRSATDHESKRTYVKPNTGAELSM